MRLDTNFLIMEIQTKRLIIYLATNKEMLEHIAKTDNIELKQAYQEMLNGAKTHPLEREFYAMWFVKNLNGENIGEICFKGIKENKSEIGYGIVNKFQNQGYGSESVNELINWALSQDRINKVFAEVECNNFYSIKLLYKLGFKKMKVLDNSNYYFEKSK